MLIIDIDGLDADIWEVVLYFALRYAAHLALPTGKSRNLKHRPASLSLTHCSPCHYNGYLWRCDSILNRKVQLALIESQLDMSTAWRVKIRPEYDGVHGAT